MGKIKLISAEDFKDLQNKSEVAIIDIREKDEYSTGYIPKAINVPSSTFSVKDIKEIAEKEIIIYCLSGKRCDAVIKDLEKIEGKNFYKLDGGINRWKKNKGEMVKGKVKFTIMSQVMMLAGSLIVLGVVLGFSLDIRWVFLSGLMGCGLVFAGFTGWCGMAKMLSKMPWNK